MNGDGVLDVAAANGDSHNITLVAGLGDGTLLPAQTVYVNDRPRCVVAGDLNNDGRQDWLVGSFGTGYVYVGTGLESGAFSTNSFYPFDGFNGDDPQGLAMGDVDGDGDMDFATAAYWDDGSVGMRNNGSASFSVVDFYYVGNDTSHVALHDVTGDAHLDLIGVSTSGDSVSVRPGSGTGSFGGATTLSTSVSTSGLGPVWVTVADVTGDNVPDILTANVDSKDVSLLMGQGSGSFTDPIPIPAVFGSGDADVSCVKVGDFNGDGLPDLATANAARNTVSIILGFGGTSFAAPQSFAVGLSPYALDVGDVDGDGLDDVVVANYGDDDVTVLLGLGHP